MKKFSFLSFFIVVVAFAISLSLASIFSSIFLLTTSLTSQTIFFEGSTYYAISLAKNENSEELLQQKVQLQSQDGAGFLYEKDGVFYLLSNLYDNRSDAELVKTKLETNGIAGEIVTTTFSENCIEGNFNSNEKMVLNECMKSSRTLYKNLYDVAVSLDTSLYDISKAKLECNKIFSTSVSAKKNFETFFMEKIKNNEKNSFSQIYKTLERNEEFLESLINETLDSGAQTYSSLIKLTYCKILLV